MFMKTEKKLSQNASNPMRNQKYGGLFFCNSKTFLRAFGAKKNSLTLGATAPPKKNLKRRA